MPVDTRLIENMIAEHTGDADADATLCDLLAVVADRAGVNPGPDEIALGVRFVCAYLEQVPYMIKVAWTAAATVGLEKEMTRILDSVRSYWVENDDVIPDQLGIIGLLDDAYCSLTSLQAVSDHYRLQTGKHLFPNDLTAANRAMRRIIGEPYVTELDRIVVRTMNDTGLIEAATSLADGEKRLNFAGNKTIWSHGPAGGLDLSDLARLGLAEPQSE